MRNKYFFKLWITILLIMLIIGLNITGNFYLSVGLVLVALIGFVIIILLLLYDNIGLLFKKIQCQINHSTVKFLASLLKMKILYLIIQETENY